MLQKSTSEYESFLYWRQPIPALDLSELEGLGVTDGKPANNKQAVKKEKVSVVQRKQQEVVEEMPEYNSFNYWREPIASIDFNLLL